MSTVETTPSAELPELDDGRYELLEAIGEGAVAKVYRARDRQSGAPVAIKILHRRAAAKLETVQRLAQEVAILAELSHPCVVQLYGTGVASDNAPYVAMEWVEGPTLRQRLGDKRRLDLEETVTIAEQVAAALSAAHREGIVHRDLKPENVMLRSDGAVKVLDFGMAKVLRQGAVNLTTGIKIFGTPQYMSAERAHGKAVGPAADVYALAVIVYEALCGRRPFDGAAAMEVLVKQCKEPVPPLDEAIPPAVAEVVVGAMAKDPAARPTAGELAHGLRQALTASASPVED